MEREELMQRIFDNMGQMKRIMHSHFAPSFESYNLSPAQFELLKMIGCNEPLSHKELAHRMQLTPGAVSQLLTGLEEADCVVRTPDPEDRRVIYLSLSPTGKRMLEDLRAKRQKMINEAFAVLSTEELAAFTSAQQKLIVWLEANAPIAKPKES